MGLVFTRHHICSIPCQNICLAHLSHRGISPKRNTHSSECPKTLCSGFHTRRSYKISMDVKGVPEKNFALKWYYASPGKTISFFNIHIRWDRTQLNLHTNNYLYHWTCMNIEEKRFDPRRQNIILMQFFSVHLTVHYFCPQLPKFIHLATLVVEKASNQYCIWTN